MSENDKFNETPISELRQQFMRKTKADLVETVIRATGDKINTRMLLEKEQQESSKLNMRRASLEMDLQGARNEISGLRKTIEIRDRHVKVLQGRVAAYSEVLASEMIKPK